MKKIIAFILAALILVPLCACHDVGEKNSDTSYEDTTGTQAVTTDEETLPEDTTADEVTTAEETTVPSTTAVENGWESVLYEEDGYEIIMGSSTLYGDPTDTTFGAVDVDTDELMEDIENGVYDDIYVPEDTEYTPVPDYDAYDTTSPEEGVQYPPVLMYHCVHDEPYTENTSLFVRPSELEGHLQVIEEMGIKTLFADEFGPVNEKSVILTFDDGYKDNYTYMFPLIKKYNVKVTIYMIAYMIDKPNYLSREQIKEMADSGLVQFGSHTLDHPALTSLSEAGIRSQFEGSNWIISQITGQPVKTIAYPSGRYNDTVMSIASEYYDFAYTTDADRYYGQDNMMLPRYFIMRGMSKAGFRTYVD